MGRLGWCLAVAACAALARPGVAAGQELADLDYENLSFRGFGFDWGYMWPTTVERTGSFGLRFDLGYAGPGLRIMPNIIYWSAPLDADKVAGLEERLATLVSGQTGGAPPVIDLGRIERSDIALGVDGHIVWSIPFNILTYGGLGVAGHILNGDGAAINGTLLEDLLDEVTAGLNLHVGAEYLVTDRFRLYTQARYEVIPDIQYFQVRFGWQIMTGENAPGEVVGR
jgi:hypothetical protein